ncbi:hypothetical protein B0T22DRAFT_472171 [Podospora appendiculata]|uniref:NAD-dependent epimerase/dehydratase domain-containing protein n=1 Tax=Podospora appendiculata TaxID=314037 RepID=A0AAE0X1S4_9PEZI|nr:hypothetical protein B0T22DRAFT_472171 [Podospora appendiculata]
MSNSPATTIPKGSLVLVTGATSFIASHIIKQFLERGYKVLGTVRDLEKAAFLTEELFADYAKKGDLELTVVSDLGAPNTFDHALKGRNVAAIVHVASPMTFDPDPSKVIPQTVAGATGLLRAAALEPSVKRFVYTSSAATVFEHEAGTPAHITKDSWNNRAVKAAWAPPPHGPIQGAVVYAASKTEAERAIWKFVDEETPAFAVNSVLPYFTLGESLHKTLVRSSNRLLHGLANGNVGLLGSIPGTHYINIKDVATAHVAGVLDADVQGQRLFLWSSAFTFNDVLAILRKKYPNRTFIDDLPDQIKDISTKDDAPVLALLKKWAGQDDWISFEQTIDEVFEGY